jgi:hypothetical protein
MTTIWKINVYEKGIREEGNTCAKVIHLEEERGDKNAKEMTFHYVIKAVTR